MSPKKGFSQELIASSTEPQHQDLRQKVIGVVGENLYVIIALILLIFYMGFRRGVKKGELLTQDFFTKKLNELSESYEKQAQTVSDAQSRFEEQLKISKIIPQNHVLVPLDEGKYFYKLPNGYVMRLELQFDHRAVAEEALARELASNEVVHHIFGKNRDDNNPENLCVLDRDYHDLWHTFLDRERRIKGGYPRIAEQKWLLKKYYGGILIGEAFAKKTPTFPVTPQMSRTYGFQVPTLQTPIVIEN